jgi:hypothetical protein
MTSESLPNLRICFSSLMRRWTRDYWISKAHNPAATAERTSSERSSLSANIALSARSRESL